VTALLRSGEPPGDFPLLLQSVIGEWVVIFMDPDDEERLGRE
jgi:hypothetical protein